MSRDGGAVEVASDKDKFDHTVAVLGIPVAGKARLCLHELHQFVLGCAREPETGLCQLLLHTGLLEEIGHVGIMFEIDHSFGTDNVRWPVSVDKEIEFVHIEATPPVVDKGLYTIFFGLSLAVIVVVMMVAVVMMLLVVMMSVMLVMMPTGFGFFFVGRRTLDFMYPGGRCSHVLEIKQACTDELLQVNVAIIAFDDTRTGLQSPYYRTDTAGLLGRNFRYLVEQDDVAELYLLDDEVFDILVVDIC